MLEGGAESTVELILRVEGEDIFVISPDEECIGKRTGESMNPGEEEMRRNGGERDWKGSGKEDANEKERDLLESSHSHDNNVAAFRVILDSFRDREVSERSISKNAFLIC